MKAKKILTKVGLALFLFVGFLHLLALYYGIAYIGTTVYIYLIFGITLYYLLQLLSHINNSIPVKNIQLSLVVVLVCFFIGELANRYVFKTNLTYKEKVSGYYSTEYPNYTLRNAFEKYILKYKSGWYYTHPPNTSRTIIRSEFSYRYSFNKHGLAFQEPDSNSNNIIIGLGDSFTEGIGAPQDSSWPAMLQAALHNNYRVLNAGKAGSDVCFEYMLMQKLQAEYTPQVVILAINTTDIDDIIIRGGMERFRSDSSVVFNMAPWWEPIYATSYIARGLINAIANPDWTLTPQKDKPKAEQKAINTIVTTVQQIQNITDSSNIKLIVSLNPQVDELLNSSANYNKLVADLESVNGIDFIDLKKEYLQRNYITATNYNKYYWPEDKHHNSAGYKIWAEIVASHLQETTK